jgi:hypothetical protein
VFALDALEDGKGLGEVLAAVALHLLPSFALIAVLVLAWRRPWVGAWLFGVAALGYAFATGRAHLDWIAFVSGPLLLTAGLYLVSWIHDLRRPGQLMDRS